MADACSLSPFRCDSWLVYPAENRIRCGPTTHVLEPRVMKLLVHLVHNAGEVQTREALLTAVWPDVLVQEDSLTKAISELRRLLEDRQQDPKFIRTIRKTGYLWLAPVRPLRSTAQSVGWAVSVLLVLALIAAGIFWEDPQQPIRMSSFSRLTSNPGQEFDPALSPDGKRVVFVVNNRERVFDLALQDIGSDQHRLLTETPEIERHPGFGPGGDRIAYIQESERADRLMMLDLRESAHRQLAEFADIGEGTAWSISGDQIYFCAREGGEQAYSVYAWDLAAHGARRISHPARHFVGDRLPRIHPTSGQMGFMRHRRQGLMALIEMDANDQEHVRFEAQMATLGWDWLAEERGWILDGFVAGSYVLFHHVSGEQRKVTGAPRWASAPRVAGNTAVFVEITPSILVRRTTLSSEDGQQGEDFISSTQLDFDAYFDPMDERIASVSTRTGRFSLIISTADGRTLNTFDEFPDGTILASPRWAPSGEHLAVQFSLDGVNAVAIVDAESGNYELVLKDEHVNVKPVWEQDRRLLFGSDRAGSWQIWSYDMDTRVLQQVTRDGGRISSPGPAGGLYYTHAEKPGLFHLPAGADKSVKVAELALQDLNNWSVRHGNIYHVDRSDGTPKLCRLPELSATQPSGGECTIELTGIGDDSLDVSAKGEVLYTVTNPRETDLILGTLEF